MLRVGTSGIDHVCERRFPAWTLYARAFSGNPCDAEALVRRAVAASSRTSLTPWSERDFHQRVLSSIRASAFASIERTRSDAPSVLDRLEKKPHATSNTIRARLRELSRSDRRAIGMLLLDRPGASLDRTARVLKMTSDAVERSLGTALRHLAAATRDPRRARSAASGATDAEHPRLSVHVAFAKGALSGDEARETIAHARWCQSCGDRLGTIIALTSSTVSTARRPLVSRGQRKAALFLLAAAGLFGVFVVADALWPNPWAVHATRDTVPPWFHDFFYRGRKASDASETSLGLQHLAAGELDEAIAILEPLVNGPDASPEAAAYLGIARYLEGDASRRTMRLLESGTRSHRAGRLSRWYLASVLLMRRDVDGARVQLEALASVRDWFGRAAEELLDALDENATETPGVSASLEWSLTSLLSRDSLPALKGRIDPSVDGADRLK